MNLQESLEDIDWNRALRPVAWALLAWILLALALAGMDKVFTGATVDPERLLRRLSVLCGNCLVFFLGPIVLLGILFGVARRQWEVALVQGIRFGSIAFGLIALFWIGVAVVAVFDGGDHWEALPWIKPPYLDDFLQRHPGFDAITYQGTRTLTLYDGKGHHAIVDGNDLVGATVVFGPCPSRVDAALLGGITPFPKGRCSTRVHIANPRRSWATYRFEFEPYATHDELSRHFSDWAQRIGAEHRLWGYRDYHFSAEKQGRTWDLWWRYGRNLTTELYIPENGATPVLPKDKDADPQDEEDEEKSVAPEK